jgi:hypothetical protein
MHYLWISCANLLIEYFYSARNCTVIAIGWVTLDKKTDFFIVWSRIICCAGTAHAAVAISSSWNLPIRYKSFDRVKFYYADTSDFPSVPCKCSFLATEKNHLENIFLWYVFCFFLITNQETAQTLVQQLQPWKFHKMAAEMSKYLSMLPYPLIGDTFWFEGSSSFISNT